ncbi:multidrug effflux MFS transporter [Rubrivirga marina]|nr:multidrug effflux MFS transporter [Rubrivirga marina]
MSDALRRQSLTLTAFLAGLSALASLSIDMGLPGIPALEAALPSAAGQGALTLSLFMVGFAISPLVAGPFSDRFGRRQSLLIGLVAFTGSALVCAAAPTFETLLAARLVQGAVAGLCVTQPLAIVRDLLDGPDARKQIAQVAVVLGLSPLAAPVLGGVVLAWGDWRTIYFVQAAISAALFVWTLVAFPESLPLRRRQRLDVRQVSRSYRAVFGNRTFLGYALVYAVGFGALFTYVAGSPDVFIGEFGLSEGAYSGAFALTAFGLVLGSFLNSRLTTTPGRRVLQVGLAVGLACSVVALGLAATGHLSAGLLVGLVFALMIAFGAISPTANHEAIQPLPHVAGAASGSIRSVQMVMGASASAAFTVLAGGLFPDPVLAMTVQMTVLMLATVGVYALLVRGTPEADGATT